MSAVKFNQVPPPPWRLASETTDMQADIFTVFLRATAVPAGTAESAY